MENTPTNILTGKYLFDITPDLFTGSTKIFFSYICLDNEYDWWKGEIENILAKYEDHSEQLHRFAECIRINIVEAHTPELKNQFTPYEEILFDAIYNCDCFAIAKELMKQYNEKHELAEAS